MKTKENKLAILLDQKNFLKVLLGNTISRFGDSLDAVAFSWLVFKITGQASWSAMMLAINFIPTVLLQPFAGTLIENWNKRKVLIITDFIRFVLVLSIVAFYLLNLLTPILMAIVTFLISTAEAFTQPARTAIMPKLLEKKHYNTGIAVKGSFSSFAELAGLGLAGIIIAKFGVWIAFVIDACTFFISGICMVWTKIKEDKPQIIQKGAKIILKNMSEGFKYIKRNKILKNIMILTVIVNGILVPINALQAPFVSDVLKQGSELMSVLGIGLVIGMGLGSMLFIWLSEHTKVLSRLFISGIIIAISFVGLLSGKFFIEKPIIVYMISLFVMLLFGIAVSIMSSTISVLFLNNVEENIIARISGISGSIAVMAMPILSLIVGLLVKMISIELMFLICGISTALFFIYMFISKLSFEIEEVEKNGNCEENKLVERRYCTAEICSK